MKLKKHSFSLSIQLRCLPALSTVKGQVQYFTFMCPSKEDNVLLHFI